ncbi:MAG: META domain-containing protein [Anaerolineales bacterium]|nr:META domain-containing protein [Anaerolineales bacterium]MCB9144955.1 META domain-containing protein [Anaerolineales bacterium]
MKLATLPALIMLTFAMVIFNACSTTSASLAGEWKLVSYGDSAAPTPALPGVDTSILFEEGQFGGTVGCNSFGGDYTLSGSQMSTGSTISTMMFCEQTSAQESAVLAILSDKTMTVTQSGNLLTLSSVDGKSVVILERK